MLLGTPQALVDISHDLLAADHEDDPPGAAGVWPDLAGGVGHDDERTVVGDRLDAAEHVVGGTHELADLASPGRPIHRQVPRTEGVKTDLGEKLLRETDLLEGPRGAPVDFGAPGKHREYPIPCLRALLDDDRLDVVAPQGI